MTDSKISDFEKVKELGKGSFGSVFLVRRKEDHKIYALKSVYLQKLNKKEQQNSVNEVRILASVNHPNVIGYKEAFWDEKDNSLNIVMEYADDGDLQTKINKMRKERLRFEENLIWSYSIQMIEGLKALHDKNIMHRDLKSANIFLVKDKYQCKIGDMNVSKVIKEKELLTQTGTPYYASPEVWRDEPYSYKSDLWSIGCVIYELCNLRPPFKGKDLDELFMNVCKGKPERIYNTYSDDLWKMIQMLLEVDVKKRCDCNKFLNSPLIVRKIKELKNENNEYKNLEKNKEIDEGNLLETIRFDNILDIKRQLPTKKNYSNTNTSSINNSNNKGSDIKNINKKKNLIKYQKINTRIKMNKIPIKKEIKKDKEINKINIDYQKKIINSPKIKKEEKEKSIVYQKPKLIENSVKREKKIIMLNNRPMTTKRPAKKFNYMEKNITPRREKLTSGNNTSIEKPVNSNRNNNVYKSGYTYVNREKKLKNIHRPIETSPNSRELEIHKNIIRKKNYSKKLLNEIKPHNATINKSKNYLLAINKTEIDLNLDNDLKKKGIENDKINNPKIYISNRENMIHMLKNENNKKTVNINNISKDGKNNNEIKEEKKYAYRKIPLKDKKIINKKKEIQREITEPELLSGNKKLNEKEKINLSLNEENKNEAIKKSKYNTKSNKEKINKKDGKNNQLICNNYFTINNTLVSYPVKYVDVFN